MGRSLLPDATTIRHAGARKIRLPNPTLPSWLTAAAVGGSLAIFLVVWSAQRHPEVAVISSLCGWIPSLLRRGVLYDNDFAREREGRLRNFPEGIVFDGRLVVASKAIGGAYFIPPSASGARHLPVVRVVAPSGRALLDVVMRDHADANALLAHLGAEAGRKRAVFVGGAQLGFDRARWPTLGIASKIFGLGLGLVGAFALVAMADYFGAILCAAFFVFALPMGPASRVEVGADGVVVRWLGEEEFTPFDGAESVEPLAYGEIRIRRASAVVKTIVVGRARGGARSRSVRRLPCVATP